jgi:hypothetical protein
LALPPRYEEDNDGAATHGLVGSHLICAPYG